ncbi:MAG TPA: hypothetical protein PLQ76_08770 [bacterium]|nr:hypothetical protein [bacterium]
MKENEIGGQCACGGKLVDYDDYIFRQALRRGVAALPGTIIACAVWAPVFFLIRLLIGGAIGDAGFSVLLILILKKIAVGAVIGVLLAVAIGIGRSDLGLFLGAVIGSMGGFFIAAAPVMPLRSDAAYRVDVVLVAVLAGVLCAATVYFINAKVAAGRAKWIGPDPHS